MNLLKTSSLVLFSLWLLAACHREPENLTAEDPYTEIVELMKLQEKAWSEGDVEGFMEHYLHSEELSFTTKNGLNKGYDSVLERYKKAYPRSENMGELKFELLESKSLGPKNHLVIGSWKLLNDRGNPSGYFSLIWERTEKGWKIVHDHTS